MRPLFTIFTATYNRAYSLPQLYRSLCSQSSKNFEWLIIDDGSTDETESLTESWITAESGFIIRYYKKDHGGKPRAINYGIRFAKGEYFFMVDSDDFLLPEAIEKFTAWVSEIQEEDKMIGVGAARGYPDGRYLKGRPPMVNRFGYVDATNLERENYDLDADMCEAYRTEIFRQFPMPEWPGEQFAPEQIALNEIALAGYRLRWHRDIVYICDYLPDGLTRGSWNLEKENPMGYAMMYNHMLRYSYPIPRKFHAACQHIALSLYGKRPGYIFKTNAWSYTILAVPFGIVLSFRRKRQFRKG